MKLDEETKRVQALAFLKGRTAGVLATVSREGKPHASAVYYVCDDKFSIYFLTLASSRKFAALQANPWAAFVVADQGVPQTMQIEGPVVQLREESELGAHLPELVQRLTSNATYFAPITKMDPADIVVMWLDAKWIRWADYTSAESGNEHVFTLLDAEQTFLD